MMVLGADTHKRSHAIAAVRASTGELLGEQTVQSGAKGAEELLGSREPSTPGAHGCQRAELTLRLTKAISATRATNSGRTKAPPEQGFRGARTAGIEPATFGSGDRRSIP
jgi:hypothetical protein